MRNLILVVIALITSTTAACGALVGDSCETQTDCGTQMYCEQSLPDGYCTRRDCELDGCPEEGVCIVFEQDLSFCMASCDNDGDCRDGYTCVKDFGRHPFCNDSRGEAP